MNVCMDYSLPYITKIRIQIFRRWTGLKTRLINQVEKKNGLNLS